MKKRIKLLLLTCLLMISMAGCGNYVIEDDNSNAPPVLLENPFEEEEDGSLAALRHGENNPNRDENQNVLPYEYNGGEFSFEYYFLTEGKLDNVGFLLFLDGKPQAYKVNSTDAEYEYCHYFETEDGKEETVTFLFTPHTGKKGDTLNLTIVSITNPKFQPNMKETSSYGWYHKHLERMLELHFNEDTISDDSIYPAVETIFTKVSVEEEKVTSGYLENELGKDGWGKVSMESLDNAIYSTLLYDGELVYDNVNITDKDTLTVRYTLCGMAGVDYKISFFLNHKPVAFEDGISYGITLHKGNVWVVEATIDTSKLSEFNTFYVAAVASGDNYDIGVNKRESILIYKEKNE